MHWGDPVGHFPSRPAGPGKGILEGNRSSRKNTSESWVWITATEAETNTSVCLERAEHPLVTYGIREEQTEDAKGLRVTIRTVPFGIMRKMR